MSKPISSEVRFSKKQQICKPVILVNSFEQAEERLHCKHIRTHTHKVDRKYRQQVKVLGLGIKGASTKGFVILRKDGMWCQLQEKIISVYFCKSQNIIILGLSLENKSMIVLMLLHLNELVMDLLTS